MTSVKIRT